jgi:hypothetical protein
MTTTEAKEFARIQRLVGKGYPLSIGEMRWLVRLVEKLEKESKKT